MSDKAGNLLIIDDNISVLNSLKLFLKHRFEKVVTLTNPDQIITKIKSENIDVILLDMNFTAGESSGKEGIRWLKAILKEDPTLSVVFITAYGGIELAVKAIREGAVDFILKPWDNQKLFSTLKAAYQLRQTKSNVRRLRQQQHVLTSDIERQFQLIKGNSSMMKPVYDTISKVAKTDANVLITGENGTGKEIVAREIHRQSLRANQIFLSVDLSSLSESLFESELFGHQKGAFTDAKTDRAGKFVVAEGGTIFLDEIGNISFTLQAKLLAAIQNRKIIPVGSNETIPVNVRLISATNKDLLKLIKNQQFREDLYYRINTIVINIPPLRDRGEDILILANHFLKIFSDKYEKPGLLFNLSAIDTLLHHHWPGNIRELKHSVEKAVILSDDKFIKTEDLFAKGHDISTLDIHESRTMDDYEKEILNRVLKKHHGNISHTAKELKIGRQTLYRKIQKYDL